MFARGVRRAASVCTISQAVATELVARYRLAPDRVHVAYPGPDSELLHAVPQPAITAGRRFVLMVGTLEPRKNHLTVLHALADHVRRRPDSPLTLVLAGSPGWHYRPVLEAIDALELTGRVERLGAVDAPRLKWLYQEAQALLFPSLYEGFGLPVLEAFALKCPVLAADIPAVRELAGPAAALLLPPTDLQAWAAALDRVADRGRDEARLTAAAERAGRFTWEACARGALAAARQAGAV
jgi:glycosyltransferase involved in cell wall biosynthesis